MAITTNNTDDLGISPVEEAQIAALSAGAAPQEVASLSRQSMEQIPRMIDPLEPSEFEDEIESPISEYVDPAQGDKSREAAKKALPASLATEGETEKTYLGMYDQFRNAGSSGLFDSIQQEVRNRSIAELDAYVSETARTGDVDSTQAALEASPELLEQESDVRVAGMTNASQAYTDAADTQRRQEAELRFLKEITTDRLAKDAIDRVINIAVADSSDELDKFALDAAGQAIFGEQALGLSAVGKDILGERYVFAGGDMMRDLAQHLRDLPVEKQEAEAQRIVDSITKHAGITTNNDLVKVFALESLRDFTNTPGGDKPFDRWMMNVVGYSEIASLLGATVAAKTLSKVLKLSRSPSSLRRLSRPTGQLQRANPDIDASLRSEALRSEEVAETLGTTRADELADALPSIHLDDTILQGAPTSLVDKLRGIRSVTEEVKEEIKNTYLFAPADYQAKMNKISNTLYEEGAPAYAMPSYSSITRSNKQNLLNARVVYGDSTELPLNYDRAFKIKNDLNEKLIESGVSAPNARIIRKDPNTQTYEDIDNIEDGVFLDDADYLVAADVEVPMFYSDIVPGNRLAPESTQPAGMWAGRYSHVASNLLTDPQSWVDRNLLGAARVANDAKFYKKHNLLKTAKPFLTLNYFGKKRVAKLLELGEEQQKVFDYPTLRGRYSEKEIEAYYSARAFNDTVYDLKNASVRADLEQQGFKGISINVDGVRRFENAGRVIEDVENLPQQTTVAWNITERKEIKVTPESIEAYREQGLVPVRLLKGVDSGANKYNYTFLPRDAFQDLPRNVFPRREGYNFRVNNDPYFIDMELTKRIDGVLKEGFTKTIAVGRSRAEAEKYIKALENIDDSAKYSVRLDRNISSTQSVLDNDVMDGSGLQFWFSKRGDRLRRSDGSLSSVEDPITAIQKISASVANVDTHKELVESSIIRHRKTYGNLTVDVNGTNIPLWSWDTTKQNWMFDKTLSAAGRPDVAAAKAEFEYIENLKYSPTTVDVAWKQVLESIDAMWGAGDNIFSKGLSKVLREGAKISPGGVSRGVAFAMTIPLRPGRHIILQGTTGLHLTGLDPKAAISSFADANLALISMATYQNPKLWAGTKQMAKLFGHNPDEWEKVFTSFRKSGKAYAIDSDIAVGEANFSWSRSMSDSFAGEMGRMALNVAKSPITIGKAIGFDTGELANQAMTYMFALRQWKKANPGIEFAGNQKALDEVTEAARNYSVDMTKTSSFGYQKGLFASLAQFQAINHKMLLKILGKDPSMKAGTGKHGRYVAGLLLMYGSAGFGLQDFYDSWSKSLGVEIPPELDDVLYGGFSQALFNKSLELTDDSIKKILGLPDIEGDDGPVRTAFSDSFAPTSGVATFAYELVENMLEGNIIEAFAGPSGTVFPNIGKAAKYVGDVWGLTDLDTEEKVLKSFQRATEQFGSFSDLYKLNLTIAYSKKMGELYTVSKDGRPSAAANSWSEVLSKATLGLNLRSDQELYTKYVDSWREVSSTGKKKEAQIDKDASHFVKYVYETWANTEDPLEVAEILKPIAFALHNGREDYGLLVYKEAMKKFRSHPKFGLFVKDIIHKHALLDSKTNFDDMRNSVMNSDAVRDEDKQKLVDGIDAAETSSEANRELINETLR